MQRGGCGRKAHREAGVVPCRKEVHLGSDIREVGAKSSEHEGEVEVLLLKENEEIEE